jgi:hypothetical protein
MSTIKLFATAAVNLASKGRISLQRNGSARLIEGGKVDWGGVAEGWWRPLHKQHSCNLSDIFNNCALFHRCAQLEAQG